MMLTRVDPEYINARKRLVSFSFIEESQINSIKQKSDFMSGLKPQDCLEVKAQNLTNFPLNAVPIKLRIYIIITLGIVFFFYQSYVLNRMFFRSSYSYSKQPFQKLIGGYSRLKKNEDIGNFIRREIETIPCITDEEQKEILDLIKRQLREWNVEISELIIFKIQDLVENKYQVIWNQCDPSEKLLLFDLAEDGCLNSTNKQKISALIDQGLIRYERYSMHGPEIFNKSFQNFVLTNSNYDQELQDQLELSKKGKWGARRTIILGTALLLFFISFTVHENIIEKFTVILTGVVAVIPNLISGLSGFTLPKFKIS